MDSKIHGASSTPSILEQAAQVVQMLTIGWVIALIEAIGALFASNAEKASMEDRDVEKQLPENTQATATKVVETVIQPTEVVLTSQPPRERAQPEVVSEERKEALKSRAINLHDVIVKENTKFSGALRARKETHGRATLTPEEYETQTKLRDVWKTHLEKYPFLRNIQGNKDSRTLKQVIDSFEAKLEPFDIAKSKVISLDIKAREMLSFLERQTSLSQKELQMVSLKVGPLEAFLNKNPHVAKHVKRGQPTSDTFEQIIKSLRQQVRRLEGTFTP